MIVEHGGDVTTFEILLTRAPARRAVVVILFNHCEADLDAMGTVPTSSIASY